MVAPYFYTSPWQPATHLCHFLVGLSLSELFPMFRDLPGSSAGRLRHLAQHKAPHSHMTSSHSTQHLTSHPHSTSLSHNILTQHTAPHITSHPHTAHSTSLSHHILTQYLTLTSHPHTAHSTSLSHHILTQYLTLTSHPHTAHSTSLSHHILTQHTLDLTCEATFCVFFPSSVLLARPSNCSTHQKRK